jgi:hypothetical protein
MTRLNTIIIFYIILFYPFEYIVISEGLCVLYYYKDTF